MFPQGMKNREESIRKKIVVIGDGNCGKTCMIMSLVYCEMPEEYVQTVFETHVTDLKVGISTVCEVSVYDTAGQESYDCLRPLSYPDTDVVLICFAVDNPDSLRNTHTKWVPEVKQYCPDVPFVLVCTKTDLRNDINIKSQLQKLGKSPISMEEGMEVANKLNAAAYMEISSLTGMNVTNVFETAIQCTMVDQLTTCKKKRRNSMKNRVKRCLSNITQKANA